MTNFHNQDSDLFTDGVAITLAAEDTWTIDPGVLVVSHSQSAIFSGFADDSLFNNGTILSSAEFQASVFFNGNNAFISNAAGARIVGSGGGIFTNCNPATVENHGIVEALGGDGVAFVGSDGMLTNSGSIYGRFSGVNWQGRDGTMTNTGLITSDNLGVFIATLDDVTTTIVNAGSGTISGAHGGIEADSGRVSLDNAGAIAGGIDLTQRTAEDDVIVNHGTISGVSSLGRGNDLFAGAGGSAGPVFGEDGNDRLVVGLGSDRLHGGFGLDTLIGGPGKDQFFFDTEPNGTLNVDRVADFTAGADRIMLADGVYTHLGADGVLAAARFHVGAVAADASDRIIYNANTGFLFYDADGKGGTAAVHFATLAPHLALHNSDFFVAHLLVS